MRRRFQAALHNRREIDLEFFALAENRIYAYTTYNIILLVYLISGTMFIARAQAHALTPY